MRAGLMRTRIAIQGEVSTPDGGGGVVKTWQTMFYVWSYWRHQSMYERLQAMQLQSGVNHRVMVRQRDDITAKHRILYKGKAYQIVAVVNVNESNDEMELQVEEGVPT